MSSFSSPAEPSPPRTVVGVAVVARSDGHVLIDCRATGPLQGWWEFPGGKADPHESLPDCIRRECREELGVEVEVLEPLRIVRHVYAHGEVELHFYLCRLAVGSSPPRPLQVADIAWVRPSETANYRFLAANTPVVEELIARLERSVS